MPIVTTDDGLNATTNAANGGFLIDLYAFAVTEAENVTLSVIDKTLVGPVVHYGEIETIEVVSNATVRLTLKVPEHKPLSGEWNLREVGIYLKSGVLFAHGTFKAAFRKTGEFGLSIHVLVTCARLGEVINVTFGSTVGLASTRVRSLVDPVKSSTNAVVVQDGATILEQLTSASMAIRYGAGGAHWAFMGHDLVWRGVPDSVTNLSKFNLIPDTTGGFWLNDEEIVIVQISAGPGSGDSRRVRYDKQLNVFTVLEKPFAALTSDSIMHVWRETKNSLPGREDIPDYFMLGVGLNTWQSVTLDSSTNGAYDLVPGQYSTLGNGGQNYNLPSSVPAEAVLDYSKVLVFVGGKHIGVGLYSIVNKVLKLTVAAAVGAEISIIYYTRSTSSGSYVTMMSAEYTSYVEGTLQFQLPILPDTKAGLMVFVAGSYIDPKHFRYEGSSVTFTSLVPEGNVAIVATCALYEVGATSDIYQASVTLEIGETVIPVDVDSFDKRNSVVTINGKYIEKDLYTTGSRYIELLQPLSNIAVVEIFIVASLALIESPSIVTTGINTGPVWADPAGAYVAPNKLVPKRTIYVADGARISFPTMNHADFAIVFVGGLFQQPATFEVDAANGRVTLNTAPLNGLHVDIISFESVLDAGEEIVCWRQNFTTQVDTLAYALDAPAAGRDPLVSILTIGGVFIHDAEYTQTRTGVTLASSVPANLLAEIWHFASIPRAGWSNKASATSFVLDKTKDTYVHAYADQLPIVDASGAANTLLSCGSVMQNASQFSVVTTTLSKLIIPNIGVTSGVAATSIMFYSGKSKTRLMTRDEITKNYMTREEIVTNYPTRNEVDQKLVETTNNIFQNLPKQFLNFKPVSGYPSSTVPVNSVPVYADFAFSRKESYTPASIIIDDSDREVMYVAASDGIHESRVYKAFRYNPSDKFLFDNTPLAPACLLANEVMYSVYNVGTYSIFAVFKNVVTSAVRFVVILTEGSSDPSDWTSAIDVSADYNIAAEQRSNYYYHRSTQRLIKIFINAENGKIISMKILAAPLGVLNVVKAPTVLFNATVGQNVSYTHPTGAEILDPVVEPYISYFSGGVPVAYDDKTETLYSTFVLATVWRSQSSGAQRYIYAGITLAYRLSRAMLVDGLSGVLFNLIPFGVGNNYKYWGAPSTETGIEATALGAEAVLDLSRSLSFDEYYRVMHYSGNEYWDSGTYLRHTTWDMVGKVVKNLTLATSASAETLTIPDASAWAKLMQQDISFLGNSVEFIGAAASAGWQTVQSQFSKTQFFSVYSPNDTIKLVPNTWKLGKDFDYAAEDDYARYATVQKCTVVTGGVPRMYTCAGPGGAIKEVLDIGGGQRGLATTGVSLPALPAGYGWLGSWGWDGGSTFYYYVTANSDNGTANNKYGRILKIVAGAVTLVPGYPSKNMWDASKASFSVPRAHQISSMLITEGRNLVFGVATGVASGTHNSSINILYPNNTYSVAIETDSPYTGHIQIGYHASFGYYVSNGCLQEGVFYKRGSFRVSKNLGVDGQSFTEAQFFVEGRHFKRYLSISPAVGLIAYVMPFPLFLGGYYGVLPSTNVALYPNTTNYIYIKRNVTDHDKYDFIVMDNQLLPNSFSRVLVAKVVTNATDVVSNQTYAV